MFAKLLCPSESIFTRGFSRDFAQNEFPMSFPPQQEFPICVLEKACEENRVEPKGDEGFSLNKVSMTYAR